MQLWGAVLGAVLATVLVVAPAPPASAGLIEDERPEECYELTPGTFPPPTSETIEVRVHLLLDGVTLGRAQWAAEQAARAYTPLGIVLKPSYQAVDFQGAGRTEQIEQAKAFFGGRRPAWAHAVVVMTDEGPHGGRAACIGGIAFDSQAFAMVAAESTDEPLMAGPLELRPPRNAGILAHELGHLFGGEHQYFNCAESVLAGPFPLCTVMSPRSEVTSLHFSSVNRAIVRGHAEAYVKPLAESREGRARTRARPRGKRRAVGRGRGAQRRSR